MTSKGWCIANDIIIYPVPVKFSEGKQKPLCKIEINYKGKKKTGEIEYKQDNKNTVQEAHVKILKHADLPEY